MRLTIDQIPVEAGAGTTILEAALSAGIPIPSMCYLPGHRSHPSCMVCLVKDLATGNLIPSCAHPVKEGMCLDASGEEVRQARKEALELLLSDHLGDCEAPCRLSCPAFMDIPRMNRLIRDGRMEEAMQLVYAEIALPRVLGIICPAPCEKACRRKMIDEPVSVCLLKRATTLDSRPTDAALHPLNAPTGKQVAVIGTGPAGLSAAYYLLREGHACVLFDRDELPGGALRTSIPDDLLPKNLLDEDIDVIRKLGGSFRLQTHVTAQLVSDEILPRFDAVILATGFTEDHPIQDFGLTPPGESIRFDKKTLASSVPGVFGCGSVIAEQLLSVRSAAQGKQAALAADAWIRGVTDFRRTTGFNSAIGPMQEQELREYMKESNPQNRIPPANGYLEGLTRAEAIAEAARCLHCDCRKPGTCKLRIHAFEYGANRKRFAAPERNLLTRNLQHEFVVYEPEKCIRCGLCVEITQKEQERLGLAFTGRGFDVRIRVPFNGTLGEGLEKAAAACVQACPTGALAFRNNEIAKY
jgi:NADPH-dependent glutamate synthase beta subunit-like oxidoreductase